MSQIGSENTRQTEPTPKLFSIGVTAETHGAGTSTVSQLLANILGFTYIYTGNRIRAIAQRIRCAKDEQDEEGVDRFIEKIIREHPQVDFRTDLIAIRSANEGNCVFEGKAAVVLAKAGLCPRTKDRIWSLMPRESLVPIFAVCLTCDPREAAKRILQRNHKVNPSDEQIKKQMGDSTKRLADAKDNWNKYYKFNGQTFDELANSRPFDLVIDTTPLPPVEIVFDIIDNIYQKGWLTELHYQQALDRLKSH